MAGQHVTAADPQVTSTRRWRRPEWIWLVGQRVAELVFGAIQAVVALRITLLLLDANPNNGLVAAIYRVSGAAVEPFRGVLRIDRISAGTGSVLDVAAVVALVAWSLIELLTLSLLRLAEQSAESAI